MTNGRYAAVSVYSQDDDNRLLALRAASATFNLLAGSRWVSSTTGMR